MRDLGQPNATKIQLQKKTLKIEVETRFRGKKMFFFYPKI
jgi:hypothetical protein